jgi:hypothetical protein
VSYAGRASLLRGRARSSPPQFGHKASNADAHDGQNVHSKLQMNALDAGLRSAEQRSHDGFMCSASRIFLRQCGVSLARAATVRGGRSSRSTVIATSSIAIER